MATTENSVAPAMGMLETAQEHERLELLFQYEQVLGTLVENPVYFWFPRGWKIEGRPAVLEMYRRLTPMIEALADSIREGTRTMDYFAVGEDQLAAEVQFEYPVSPGEKHRVRIAAFVPFRDALMIGETQYVDRILAAEIDRMLGADFGDLPGVSLI